MNVSLESTLRDILAVIVPQREDYELRRRIIRELQDVVATVPNLRGATVEPFGSFVSNLFTPWGDLDITVMLDYNSYISFAGKKRKITLLGDVLRALKLKGQWWRLQFIPNAKVPILKFEKGYPAISGDISIDNLGGRMKSSCLFWLTQLDERFRPMVLLVKEWAKANDINNPKFGTLNSYSLSLLVVFHFQTCDPPIFPPLNAIYPTDVVDDLKGVREVAEGNIKDLFNANIKKFETNKSRPLNRSPLSELFVSFIAKFSAIHAMAQDYGICPFTGQWETINNNTRWFPRTFSLYVEDPFEQPANTARTVSERNLSKIQEAFRRTHGRIVMQNLGWFDLYPLLVKRELVQLIMLRKQNEVVGQVHHHLPQQQQTVRHSPVQVQGGRVANYQANVSKPQPGNGSQTQHRLLMRPKQETGSKDGVSESNANRRKQERQQGDVNKLVRSWRPK